MGKHINAYLLQLTLDYVVDEVEYLHERSAPLGAETPKRR
jgi:hypothetical protein